MERIELPFPHSSSQQNQENHTQEDEDSRRKQSQKIRAFQKTVEEDVDSLKATGEEDEDGDVKSRALSGDTFLVFVLSKKTRRTAGNKKVLLLKLVVQKKSTRRTAGHQKNNAN